MNKIQEEAAPLQKIPLEERSFRGAIAHILPGETYECEGFIMRCLQDKTIEIEGPDGHIFGFLATDMFIKLKRTFSTWEAWKAYEEEKIIVSVVTSNKYIKRDGHMYVKLVGEEHKYFESCDSIDSKELSGKWYIREE